MKQTNDKISPGYKQTEIGMIPGDWEVKRLEKICDYKNGKSFEKYVVNRGKYLLITLDSLDINGNFKKNHLKIKFFDKSLNKNDLIMILSDVAHGNFLGLTNVIPEDNKYVLNQRVGALKNIKFIQPYYLSKYINFRQKYFKNVGQGSSQQNLGKKDILNFKVLFPSLKSEQTAIAQVLSDTGDLIEKLEKLIDKKKKIKQGAMQELLTGKRRLPGFSGKWEVKKLGDFSHIKTGNKNNEDKSADGKYPFFVRSQTVERINSYSYDCEAILVPGEGGIGTIFHYVNGKFDYHQRVYKISYFANGVSGRFIYYYMLQNFNKQATKNSVKATVDSLRLPTFKEFELFIPNDPKEQTAIVQVLSNMDAEIEALEKERDKYQQIKQGMMQVLLTGKIRLIKN